jgi:hypothetical protein
VRRPPIPINVCFAAQKLDKVPPLKKGDLVMFMVPRKIAAMGAGCAAGLIVAKVKPIQCAARWLADSACLSSFDCQ